MLKSSPVTTASDGAVTHVRIDSWPPTTRTKDYTELISRTTAKRKAVISHYRSDAWRGENRAERFRFPNYADAEAVTINRVLLDLGLVAYRKGHPVVFNIMTDNHGSMRWSSNARENKLNKLLITRNRQVFHRRLHYHCIRRTEPQPAVSSPSALSTPSLQLPQSL